MRIITFFKKKSNSEKNTFKAIKTCEFTNENNTLVPYGVSCLEHNVARSELNAESADPHMAMLLET